MTFNLTTPWIRISVVSSPTAGLRERKKARTRTLIADTASGLFAANGFDEVTVSDVADAAEVSVSTVFNYFPAKEDLFYDRQDEVVEHLSRVVTSRAPGESFLDAARRDTLQAIAKGSWQAGLGDNIAKFYRLVDRSPALQARARLITELSAAHLTATLAAELDLPPDHITAITAARLLTAVRTCLLEQARRSALAGETPKTTVATLKRSARDAFALLDGNLASLGSATHATK